MARKIIIVAAIAACAAGAAFMLMRKSPHDGDGELDVGERSGKPAEATPGARRITDSKRKSSATAAAARRAARTSTPTVEWYETLPEKDRNLASAVQNALDSDDFANVLRTAEAAMASTNTEVRLAAIEALGYFGEKALVELMPYMADKDEDVADAARSAWEMALSEVESPKERLNAAMMVLETISDKDSLAMIAAQLSNSAAELIDSTSNEEKSRARREEILLAIESVISSGKPANAAAAREAYEDITGHEWVNAYETKLYLSDPDGYETPEERRAAEVENGAYASTATTRRRSSSSRHRPGSGGDFGEADVAGASDALDALGDGDEADADAAGVSDDADAGDEDSPIEGDEEETDDDEEIDDDDMPDDGEDPEEEPVPDAQTPSGK